MTKYLRLQTVAVAIFVLGFGALALSFVWKEVSARRAEAQCNCASPRPTPMPSPIPSPVPTPIASPVPTPTPSSSPEPEASPTPSSPRPSSRATNLHIDDITCEDKNFSALMTVRKGDEQQKDVKVKFTYGDQEKETTTDSDGWARVHFDYKEDGTLKADPEGSYASHSEFVDGPSPEECAGRGGSSGEVLGATTMAPTGVLADGMLNALGNIGGILTVVGTSLYARNRKVTFHK